MPTFIIKVPCTCIDTWAVEANTQTHALEVAQGISKGGEAILIGGGEDPDTNWDKAEFSTYDKLPKYEQHEILRALGRRNLAQKIIEEAKKKRGKRKA